MRSALVLVAFAGLSGCGAAPTRPVTSTRQPPPPTTPEKPAETCIADELSALVLQAREMPECTAENLACRETCQQGDASACFNRAVAIQRDRESFGEAMDLFQRACKLGLATGCTNWAAGAWVFRTGVPWRCLYRVFEQTCRVNDPFGCGMMGRLLIQEGKTEEDLQRARGILEHACDAFRGAPCRMLAYYLEQTFGTTDRDRIQQLLKRACDGGDAKACGVHATASETFPDAKP